MQRQVDARAEATHARVGSPGAWGLKASSNTRKPTTKTISLRLPQHLLDSLRVAANARDVPYQSLIKVWLQEKLQNQ